MVIRVKVRVYATLISEVGDRELTVELSDDSDVLGLLQRTGLSRIILEESGVVKEMYKVLVNGRDIEFLNGVKTKLRDGDVIDIFPPVAGGLCSHSFS